MEQFDTDTLVDSKKKEDDNTSTTRYLLIGICCLIVLCACYILFRYLSVPASSDSSK